MADITTREALKITQEQDKKTLTIIPTGEIYKGGRPLRTMDWLTAYLPNGEGRLKKLLMKVLFNKLIGAMLRPIARRLKRN